MPIKKPLKRAEAPPPTPKKSAAKPRAAKRPTPANEYRAALGAPCPREAMFSLWGEGEGRDIKLVGVGGGYRGYVVSWSVDASGRWRRSLVEGKLPQMFGAWGSQEKGLLIAVGVGLILRFEPGDGWRKCSYHEGATLYRVGFAEACQRLWAVGDSGVVVCSQDEGSSWQRVQTPISGRLITVFAAGSLVLLGSFNGEICRSDDDGASWRLVRSGAQPAVNRFWSSGGALYAVTNKGGLLCSRDRGVSWEHSNPGAVSFDLEGGCGDAREMFLVGQDNSLLHKTENKGWERLPRDVSFWDAISVGGVTYLASNDGRIFQYTSAGPRELLDSALFSES